MKWAQVKTYVIEFLKHVEKVGLYVGLCKMKTKTWYVRFFKC